MCKLLRFGGLQRHPDVAPGGIKPLFYILAVHAGHVSLTATAYSSSSLPKSPGSGS
jgi:hypothetical protein